MNHPLLPPAPTLTWDNLERVRAGCSHAIVPSEPAASGYRYYDLGGGAVPFYMRRISAGPIMGSVTLSAPIELSTGEDAERGARGIARAGISIGTVTVPWGRLSSHAVRGGVWADMVRQALEALSELELMEPDCCPICASADDVVAA